jgi:hypothetical protein
VIAELDVLAHRSPPGPFASAISTKVKTSGRTGALEGAIIGLCVKTTRTEDVGGDGLGRTTQAIDPSERPS